jgi:hypothetical protein
MNEPGIVRDGNVLRVDSTIGRCELPKWQPARCPGGERIRRMCAADHAVGQEDLRHWIFPNRASKGASIVQC